MPPADAASPFNSSRRPVKSFQQPGEEVMYSWVGPFTRGTDPVQPKQRSTITSQI